MATCILPIQTGKIRKTGFSQDRASCKGAAFWLPHVRKLPASGDSIYLPDGMP
jgi:hypothetical protein